MGKVIPFKAPRPQPKIVPRPRTGECERCHHKLDVHIKHPDGSISCAARGCTCHTPAAE